MLTATLGGLIKDYRIRKRLSQMEVSLKIGWKDTSRLSKIEQGRVGKPTRKTAEKIIEALGLSEQEKGEFLLVGGYLPTDEEVKKAIKEVKEKIDTWPYPAYLIDFSWRNLYVNEVTFKVFGVTPILRKNIIAQKMNILELVLILEQLFSARVIKGKEKHDGEYLSVTISQFKREHMGWENEKWYVDIVKRLIKYEVFRSLWPSVDQNFYEKKLMDYEYKIIRWEGEKITDLKFHVFCSRLIADRRFQVVFYVTTDQETVTSLKSILQANPSLNKGRGN